MHMQQPFSLRLLQPFGLEINATNNTHFITLIAGKMLAELVKQFRVVILRGFNALNRDELVDYARTIGSLLEWEFGSVMEMRVQANPKNYLFTNGCVPFHWDGAFHQVPRYLLFHCIEAPLANTGGETLFCDTTRILQTASATEKTQWQGFTLNYCTEKLAHYGGSISQRLIQEHPDTKQAILRFAEPVPTHMLNPVTVRVENVDETQSQHLIQTLTKRCYQKENCYQHNWQQHDFLIADNYALIHGRHAFKAFSPRHLRRIQVL